MYPFFLNFVLVGVCTWAQIFDPLYERHVIMYPIFFIILYLLLKILIFSVHMTTSRYYEELKAMKSGNLMYGSKLTSYQSKQDACYCPIAV